MQGWMLFAIVSITACGQLTTEGDWTGTGTPSPSPSGTGSPTPSPTPVPSASLVVNEVYVAVGGGEQSDANRDGSSDPGDQFVEIVNVGGANAELAGIVLEDSAATRYTFAPGTVAPGKAIVVFAAGAPSGAGVCNTTALATTGGSLAFDTNDLVRLRRGADVLSTYSWTTLPSSGESKTRKPDGTGNFEDHGAVTIDGLNRNFSPGCRYTGQSF